MENSNEIIGKRIKEKQARIDKAINIREKSIAYFNSVNSALELAKFKAKKKDGNEKIQQKLLEWRDWFYQQWQEWYLDEVMPEKLITEDTDEVNADLQAAQEPQVIEEPIKEPIEEPNGKSDIQN